MECGDDIYKIKTSEKKVSSGSLSETNKLLNNNQQQQQLIQQQRLLQQQQEQRHDSLSPDKSDGADQVHPANGVVKRSASSPISNGSNGIHNHHNSTTPNDAKISSSGSKSARVLVVTNHQSTADVPLMMQAFLSRSKYVLLWIMDRAFMFTNFGLISVTHGDYFIETKSYRKSALTKHCLHHPQKNFVVLFPEGEFPPFLSLSNLRKLITFLLSSLGGFRYKRQSASNKYADKQGWPRLEYVTWPRYGAYNDLILDSLGFTHIVDLTVMYSDINNPISLLDIGKGSKTADIIFYYRIYDLNEMKDGPNEDWLKKIWMEKEQIMKKFYSDKEAFLKSVGEVRKVQLNYFKMVGIHLFYIFICYWMFSFYKLLRLHLF